MGNMQEFDAIKALEEELKAAEQRVQFLKGTILYLKEKQAGSAVPMLTNSSSEMGDMRRTRGGLNGYPVDGTLKAKVLYILKKENRFLHIRELAAFAERMEPTYSLETWMKRFSPALNTLKIEEKIINIKPGKAISNTFWGSEKWLKEDGSVLPGHEYDPKYAGDTNEEVEI